MAYFYVNSNTQSDGYHEVHNDDANCPHPPLLDNRVRIGEFDTCADAIKACRLANPLLNIDGCAYCTNCHTR